jgi:hypothetical protein
MNSPSRTSAPAASPRAFLPAAFILTVLGLGGLVAVLLYTQPNGGTRWLFFFTAVIGLSGLALPLTAYLNQRFATSPPAPASAILRQALWLGLYFPTLAWLQVGRVLTSMLALLLAVSLLLIEVALRLRERSQWKP